MISQLKKAPLLGARSNIDGNGGQLIRGHAEGFEGIEQTLARLFAAAAALTVGNLNDDVIALHHDPLYGAGAHIVGHLIQPEQIVGRARWTDKEAVGKKDQNSQQNPDPTASEHLSKPLVWVLFRRPLAIRLLFVICHTDLSRRRH